MRELAELEMLARADVGEDRLEGHLAFDVNGISTTFVPAWLASARSGTHFLTAYRPTVAPP